MPRTDTATVAAPQSNRPRTSRVGGWTIAVLLLILMMINFADKAVLGLAADDIRHDLGLSAAQYGTIASGFFLLFSVSALAVGYVADRFATKPVLLVLALVWAVALFPVLGTAGFGVLLASRIVLGAAEGPAFGVANHSVQKWFSDADRNLPTAMLALGPSLGVIIAAPTLTWLMVHHGWRSMFVALIIAGLVWAAVWAVVGKEGPLGRRRDGAAVRDDAPTPATTPAADAAVISAEDVTVDVPTRRVLATGTWIGCSLAVFAAYWSLSLVVAWLPPYLTNGAGYTKSQTGTLTALPWIVAAIVVVAQGAITQRLMKRGVSGRWASGALGGGVVVLSGVCTWAFVHVPNGPLKLVLMALGLGLSGVMFTVATTACGQISPARSRGAVLGAFVAVYSLAGVVAPFVTGRLVGDAKSAPLDGYNTVFTLTGIILIIGGIAAIALIRPERDAIRVLQFAAPKRLGNN